ncbi:MAG: GGDEF domain-containing protein, partial [Campylobacterota bacterium]|nr:GGDEF domain-containing protein [Campylobacterota bacterium]
MQNNNLESSTSENSTQVEDYKDTTDKSLTSYENTNESFRELTKKYQKTVEECLDGNTKVDTPTITAKFNDIHELMGQEVTKASKTIVELSKQVKTLVKTSNIDSLTKILNRHALISYLDKICLNNKIHYDLHFILFSINDFQDIHNSCGHLAGDRILIYTANILKKTFRDSDKIFRYGGED